MTTETPTLLLWTPFLVQAEGVAKALATVEEVRVLHAQGEEEAIALLPRADGALFAGAGKGYTQELARAIAASPRLRWIQVLSTGIDGLEAFGVPAHLAVTGIGDAGASVVAEHAVALLLALVRQLPAAVVAGREGRWDRAMAPRMGSLEGSHVAVLGCGPIGQGIARHLRLFGARCTGLNRSGREPAPGVFDQVLPLARQAEVLGDCDAVVNALPLTAATRHVVNRDTWALCRPGVLVVNVGRGATMHTPDLLAALESGRVGAAALDVTDPEPLPPDHPLWRLPNVLVTPHVGGAGSAAVLARVTGIVCDNARRFARGEALRLPIAPG